MYTGQLDICMQSCYMSAAAHPLQVYDVVLDAALHTQKCGPRKLLVTGAWEWLLHGFAGDLLAAGMLCKAANASTLTGKVLHPF